MGLTREQIFAARDTVSEPVAVPEWGDGGTVNVRSFDLAARNAFLAPLHAAEPDQRASVTAEMDEARLLVFACVDDDGKPLFTESDIPALRAKAPGPIDRIALVARRLNGLGSVAAEVAAKN